MDGAAAYVVLQVWGCFVRKIDVELGNAEQNNHKNIFPYVQME